MYTRNQGNTRPSPAVRGSAVTGSGADNSAGMPILIPQEYRGELLRGHHAPLMGNDSADGELPI